MKLLTVVGARPQFIKAATVSRVIAQRDGISEVLVHTGQHYDTEMSDIFFTQMGIPKPDHQLAVGSGGHGAQTGRMLEQTETVLLDERPDAVLVYGDTNSTLAGALAAVKLHIPVAHVEAGLRSFNRVMPEEINRVLTDHAADVLYAPTDAAVGHLRAEGIEPTRIVRVGDVMLDASQFYRRQSEATLAGITGRDDLAAGGYILATVHRAENTDDAARLRVIVEGLAQAARQTQRPVVLPLHPRTRAALERYGLRADAEAALHLIEPVGFLEMVRLEADAAVIATDSGGVQKEAYFFGVPCVTLRDETEWVELIEHGWNRLAPLTGADDVADTITAAVGSTGADVSLYGDGQAAAAIVADLQTRYG